jgi:hypothetical protein
MERVKGIEPSSQAWEARILPLNHTRNQGCLIPYPISSRRASTILSAFSRRTFTHFCEFTRLRFCAHHRFRTDDYEYTFQIANQPP